MHTESPKWIVSAMFVLNTLAVAIFQVRVARGVTDMTSAGRYVVRGGLLLGVACVVFAYPGSDGSMWSAVVLLLTATAIQTLGEMMQSPATWEISFGLTPRADTVSKAFLGFGLTVAELVGPLVLTGLLVYWGSFGWIVLGALFVAASFAMVPAVRWGVQQMEAAKVTAVEPRGGREPAPGRVLSKLCPRQGGGCQGRGPDACGDAAAGVVRSRDPGPRDRHAGRESSLGACGSRTRTAGLPRERGPGQRAGDTGGRLRRGPGGADGRTRPRQGRVAPSAGGSRRGHHGTACHPRESEAGQFAQPRSGVAPMEWPAAPATASPSSSASTPRC